MREALNKPAAPAHQAVQIVSIILSIIMAISAVGWITSNIREIAPENRAVVSRLGALNRVQESGLIWAWPEPLETVRLVPAAATVLERSVQTLRRQADANTAGGAASDRLAGSGFLLTADASVVQLDVRVFFRVTDPFVYALQEKHVLPALDRLSARSAVAISASRDLDSILVARPEMIDPDSGAAEKRERLRSDLVTSINGQLRTLQAQGAGLGIEVERADVQSALPGQAVSAFDAVLTANQQAEQAVAAARNDAEKDRQAADQAVDRIMQVAEAQSSERLAKARADTASIASFGQQKAIEGDQSLAMRLYRERIAVILAQAGSVVTIDPRDDERLILQGVEQ